MHSLQEEKKLFSAGYTLIGGIDEVGRGPLAGPVLSACVLMPLGFEIKNKKLLEVNDSKKLSEKKREELYDIIIDSFPAVGIGLCDHETIDRINILEATFLAMKKSLGDLKEKPECILVDGKFKIPNLSLAQRNFIKGDASVFLIAAASIIAKVTRDRMMHEADEKYPQYGFAQHKGYGTKFHMEALKVYGACAIHRKSFAPVAKQLRIKN
jgi:ribonuclease HII